MEKNEKTEKVYKEVIELYKKLSINNKEYISKLESIVDTSDKIIILQKEQIKTYEKLFKINSTNDINRNVGLRFLNWFKCWFKNL